MAVVIGCSAFVASSLLIRVVDGLSSRYPRYTGRVAVSLATWGLAVARTPRSDSSFLEMREPLAIALVSITNVQSRSDRVPSPIIVITQPEALLQFPQDLLHSHLHGTLMNLDSSTV
jgi:hypothetical protein